MQEKPRSLRNKEVIPSKCLIALAILYFFNKPWNLVLNRTQIQETRLKYLVRNIR